MRISDWSSDVCSSDLAWTGRAVHPMAIALLESSGIPTEHLRSKSWEEFATAGAPEIDIVITVCDSVAGEVCPIWPGHPVTAHWGIEDPAAVVGDGERRAFESEIGRASCRERVCQYV